MLDTARFKYPPHWVPLELLFAAMQAQDGATGQPRGWLGLRAKVPDRAPVFSDFALQQQRLDPARLDAAVEADIAIFAA